MDRSAFALLLFTSVVAAGCAPKTSRKPLNPPAPGGASQPSTPGTNPVPRAEPNTSPGTTPPPGPGAPGTSPSSTPSNTPSTSPSTTPSSAPSTTPATGPAAPNTGPSTTPSTTPPSSIPAPQDALAQIGEPVAPPPEQETKPGMITVLWMRLSGDGGSPETDPPGSKISHFEPEVHIVASPPLKDSRTSTQVENARFISYPFEISNYLGTQTTKGYFEFRHPTNGLIEPFHLEETNKSGQPIKTLASETDDLVKNPDKKKPFEIQIRVPINEVTWDLVFSAAGAFQDYEKRLDALTKTESDKNLQRKELDSFIRLAINKDNLVQYFIKPALKGLWDSLTNTTCNEEDPQNPGQIDPTCHGKIWAGKRQQDDIKAFMAYLDPQYDDKGGIKEPSQATRLIQEYLKAETDRRQYEATLAQTQAAAGQGAAIAPPPLPQSPAPAELDIKAGKTRVLKTESQPSGRLAQPNRIKLVFVGDAFSAADSEKFYTEAQKKWDYLFGNTAATADRPAQKGIEPFRTYRSYFMGLAISTESQQSKACHLGVGKCPGQTALESSFNLFGIERLLGMSTTGKTRMAALVRSRVPDYDLAAVIVNDPQYGGAGGTYAMVSLNDEANEVIAHELMGHSFAKLGDEYGDPYPSFPPTPEPNTTMDDQDTKWALHLSDNSSQLENPNKERAKDFELKTEFAGAHYHWPKNGKTWDLDDPTDPPDGKRWYRAFETCKMRVLGIGVPFCSICREAIIKAIYRKVKPIDAVVIPPATDGNSIEVKGDGWKIQVQALQPEPNTSTDTNASAQLMTYQWFTGDKDCKNLKPIATATGDTLTSSTANLQPGNYTVCALVRDTNPDVAVKPGQVNLLEQTRAFQLKIKK